jgi:hypothetical protein
MIVTYANRIFRIGFLAGQPERKDVSSYCSEHRHRVDLQFELVELPLVGCTLIFWQYKIERPRIRIRSAAFPSYGNRLSDNAVQRS